MSERSIITVGNFDGVHRGHRAILARARELGLQHGDPVKAITFEPHPATILRPQQVPPRISDSVEKVRCLREAGADEVVVVEPGPKLLGLDAIAFLEFLVANHQPRVVVEGPNFCFGKGRGGDVAVLAAEGVRLGYAAVVVDTVEVALADSLTAPVSSSLVRWLVGHGRVADAARCLGRVYTLTGRVTAGDKRGRTIGVPTANLAPTDIEGKLLPAEGVYGGRVELPDGSQYPAAVSIGVNPTFAATARTVEAHLLGFNGDLYGHPITILFERWLREQRRFSTIDALRDQLERDIDYTQALADQGLMDAAIGDGPGDDCRYKGPESTMGTSPCSCESETQIR